MIIVRLIKALVAQNANALSRSSRPLCRLTMRLEGSWNSSSIFGTTQVKEMLTGFIDESTLENILALGEFIKLDPAK